MRIIAGTARGRRLRAPKSSLPIRPTLDRVREALFNILGPRIGGARFLDCFAGTGAVSAEALSRGAAEVVLTDDHAEALALCRANTGLVGASARVRCIRARLPQGLAQLPGPFDLVFADPPYAWRGHLELLAGLHAHQLLAPGAWVVVEHAPDLTWDALPPGMECLRTRIYGDTALSFFA